MSIKNYESLIREPDEGAPLIFAFHGTGGDERQFFGLAQQLVAGAGVVSPRGDVSERGAARFFRRAAEGIYNMEDLAARTEKMTDFIAAYKALYPLSPVYGFGYSNGANILASVLMKNPHLFDRLGLLHPLVTWALDPDVFFVEQKVLITAGRRDPICPWPMSEKLINWFQTQGATVSTEIHNGGHELRQSEFDHLADLFRTQT